LANLKMVLVLAFVICAILVGPGLISTPSAETQPPTGSWSFTVPGCIWPFPCSHYRLNYHFPSTFNTYTTVFYNVTFYAESLEGWTHQVNLHLLNVTIQNGNQIVSSQLIHPEIVLNSGNTSKAIVGNLTFTDSQLGLAPGQTAPLAVSVTVQLDEIDYVGFHYSKSVTMPSITILAHSPAPLAASSEPSSPTSLTTLIGGAVIILIVVGLAVVVLSRRRR